MVCYFIIANDLQQQLKSFKVILCDEAEDRVIRILLENVRKEQHLVVFTAEKKRNVDQRFKQFLLRCCLRSTSELAWVANSYHARQLKPVLVHTASPSKTFHGEKPDVRWADESCPAEKSNGNDFMRKSVEAIRELADEPGLDFVVVPLIRKDLLQNIVDDLSRDLLCNVDENLVEKKAFLFKFFRDYFLQRDAFSIKLFPFLKIILKMEFFHRSINSWNRSFLSLIHRMKAIAFGIFPGR